MSALSLAQKSKGHIRYALLRVKQAAGECRERTLGRRVSVIIYINARATMLANSKTKKNVGNYLHRRKCVSLDPLAPCDVVTAPRYRPPARDDKTFLLGLLRINTRCSPSHTRCDSLPFFFFLVR